MSDVRLDTEGDSNEGGEGNNWNGTGHEYENTKLEVQAILDQCR